jgi:hypothetical protein
LRAAVRRWLALQSLQQSQLFRELDKEDREEVEQQFREKEGEIAGLLLATYSRLFRPSAEGVEELRILLKRDGKTLVEMVAAALKERGILVDSLSPEYLSDTLGVGQRPVSLAEVQTVLVGSPGQPVVSEPRKMLEDAIREGVQRGLFAVRAGNQTYRDHVPEEVLDRADAVLVAPQEAPPKPEVALSPAGGTLRVTGGGENLYPLRKLLEEVQGADVSVTLTLEDPLGVLTPRRSELERLLNDYSVPYEWMEGESTD